MTDLVVWAGGYVGLTAATSFAAAGRRVLVYDPDRVVVDAINAGRPRAGEFLSYLDADVKTLVADGRLRATDDMGDVARNIHATHLIAVPTEKDGRPHDAIVLDVLNLLLATRTDPSLTVIVESTLMPGTVDRFFAAQPGAREAITAGATLAVCPRRDWFASRDHNMATLPRVVGGVTPRCTEKAMAVLGAVSPRLLPTDYRTAELTKAVENALLHTSVMLGYQLAWAFPDHDIAEVLRLASTHWRFASLGPLYLGFGSGGRCVGMGSRYLHEARGHPALWELSLAREALMTDDEFRSAVADVVYKAGARSALVLGVAYRPEFKDAGSSPGLAVAQRLKVRGMRVAVHDALWTEAELVQLVGDTIAVPGEAVLVSEYDAVLLATPHRKYLEWPEWKSAWRPGQIVLDGQGAWAAYREVFHAAGVRYAQVGTPGWMTP